MRIALSLASLAAGLVTLAAAPAMAQTVSNLGSSSSFGGGGDMSGPGYTGRDVIGSPADVGILSTTGSRLNRTRREMNRDRTAPFEVRMSRREVKAYTEDLLQRADIQCGVSQAEIVARTTENIPVIEVNCAEGGGLVIADTLPIQATDCLDFGPVEGQAAADGVLNACRLPGNVASVNAARQSARN